MSLVFACTFLYLQLSLAGFELCKTVTCDFLIDNAEHINKSTSSKRLFKAKQQKAGDSRLKAAHDKQDRLWATNAMGMQIGIDDAEEDESFNSKDNLKRWQEQHLSSNVSQRWASSILMMFKTLKFWQDVSTVYTTKTPQQDFPLLAIRRKPLK